MVKLVTKLKIFLLLGLIIAPSLLFTGCISTTTSKTDSQGGITEICEHKNYAAKVEIELEEPTGPIREKTSAIFRITFKNEGEFPTTVRYSLQMPFGPSYEDEVTLREVRCSVIKNQKICRDSKPIIKVIRVPIPENAVGGNYILAVEYPYEGYASAVICLLDPDLISMSTYDKKNQLTICSPDDIIPICKAASPVIVSNIEEYISGGNLSLTITLKDAFATEGEGKLIGIKPELTKEYTEKRVFFDKISLKYGEKDMDIRNYCFTDSNGYYVDFSIAKNNIVQINCENIPLDRIIQFFDLPPRETKLRGRNIKLEIHYTYKYREEYLGNIAIV